MSKSYTTLTRVRKNLSGENDPVAQDLEPESSLSYVKLTIADKSFDIDPFDTNWIDTKHHNLSVAYSRQQYGTPPTTSETFTLTTTFSTTISTTSSTPGDLGPVEASQMNLGFKGDQAGHKGDPSTPSDEFYIEVKCEMQGKF